MLRHLKKLTHFFTLGLILVLFNSCSSYDKFKKEADDFEIPSIIINANVARTWAAVVSTIKRYEIEQQNMDSGVIKTKWINNTISLNFTDSFNAGDKLKGARFKMLITVSSANASKSKPQSKITIYKRQLVESDAFQGWKEVDTDYILERTLLYRIQRVVAMDGTIEKLQKEKESRMIKNFENQTTEQNQLIPDMEKSQPTIKATPIAPSDQPSEEESDDFPEM